MKLSVKIFVVFFLLILFGCKLKPAPEPDMDRELLKKVFYELSYANAALKGLPSATKDSIMIEFKHQICTINKLSYEDLQRNLQILEDNPEYLEGLLIELNKEYKEKDVD